jgi:hypothetical protein
MLSIFYAATTFKRFWLLVGIGLSALVCPAVGRAQDPVEELRQALRMKLADRSLPADERLGALIAKKLDAFDQSQKNLQKQHIEAVLPRLQTISQLRRAYFLPEWVGAPIYELAPE